MESEASPFIMTASICYPFMMNWMGGSLESAFQLARDLPPEYDPHLVFPAKGEATNRVQDYGLKPNFASIKEKNIKEFTKINNNGIIFKIYLMVKNSPYLYKAIKYIKDNNIELVHTNDLRTTIFWGIAANATNTPLVWHVRQENTSKKLDKLRFFLSNHVIFCSHTITRSFTWANLESDNQSVVHNGVNIKQFYSRDSHRVRKELDIPSGEYMIGFVGNLEQRKRPLLFAEAAKKVLDDRNDCHFFLAGGSRGKMSKKVEEVAKRSRHPGRLRYLGYRDDIPQLMSDLDLLVLTSEKRGEAFPRVILEAMASETPVITTNAAGVTEVVSDGQTGRVLPAQVSPDELADCIIQLLTNRDTRERYATSSRETICADFTTKDTSEQIFNIYYKVINKSN